MATHSSIRVWRIPGTEEPGATVHEVTKSRTRLSDSHFTSSLGQRASHRETGSVEAKFSPALSPDPGVPR